MQNVNPKVASLLDEIRERLELFESNLPKRIDAIAVSPISTLPSKVLWYREALIWRMAEVAREAFESFQKDKLAAAIVLTRAAVETSAALWYLCKKVAAAVDSAAVDDIDDYLMRLVVGVATSGTTDNTTSETDLPRPIRVKTFLEQAEKDIEGFSHQYGILSEYAHPNWAGTIGLYAKHDTKNLVTDFGPNIRLAENTRVIGAGNLSVALAMFENAYNRLCDLIPAFITLCEKPFTKEEQAPR